MKALVVHGSIALAQAICPIPSTCWAGFIGSQVNSEMRELAPTGSAPDPMSLYACRDVSMQKFVRPTSSEHARIGWACSPPVVERYGHHAVRPGGDRRLELVGRLGRLDVVVDLHWIGPVQPAVG